MNDRDRLDLARERLCQCQMTLRDVMAEMTACVLTDDAKLALDCLADDLSVLESALGRPVTPQTLFSVEG